MDTSLVPIGEVCGPFTAYIDPDEVAAFAAALNDDDPRYARGSVPPTYPVVPGYPVMRRMTDLIRPDALVGARGGVHGIHDLRLYKPVVPGTHLHTTAERVGVVTSPAGMNILPRLRSVDEDGDLVAEQYWSTLYLGDVVGGSRGEAAPDHGFPEDARARLVGRLSLPTTADQTFRYAGASADRASIHVSDEAAQRAGFPRKFNQGLCTLGLATRVLVALAADGDPARVSRVAVRFAAPAFPGADLDVAVYEIGALEGGDHAYAFEAVSDGITVLRHGRVEVRRVSTE